MPHAQAPLTKINLQKVFRSAKTVKMRLKKFFGTIRIALLFVGALMGASYVGYSGEPPTNNNEPESTPKPPAIARVPTYEAAAAAGEEEEKAKIAQLSKKVAELNTNADRDGRRRAELEAAISDGRGGSDAMGELQILRKSTSITERKRYIQELDAKGVELSKNLAATRIKIEKLNTSRASWLNRNKTSELDAEERKLVGWSSSLASAIRINSILLNRLRSGATMFADRTTSPPQSFEERFFQTR
jgi:hypothetical protein